VPPTNRSNGLSGGLERLRQPGRKRRGGGVVREQKVDKALTTSFEAEKPPTVEEAQDE
jgi:hypothetical protein